MDVLMNWRAESFHIYTKSLWYTFYISHNLIWQLYLSKSQRTNKQTMILGKNLHFCLPLIGPMTTAPWKGGVGNIVLWLGQQGIEVLFLLLGGKNWYWGQLASSALVPITRFVWGGILNAQLWACIALYNKWQPFSYIHSSTILQFNILPSHSFYLFYKLPWSYDYVFTFVPLANLKIRCSFQVNQTIYLKEVRI